MSDISYQDYWTEVRSIAKQVAEEAKEQDSDVQEMLWETIDSHQWVIYTAYNFDVLKHSKNDSYTVEELGYNPSENGSMDWAQLAFGALYGDVSEELVELGQS